MGSVNLKVTGLSGLNLPFFKLGEVISNGLGANIVRMAMVSDDAADVMASYEGSVFIPEGSFSYTSPEGQPFKIKYIADENGFQG